MATAGVNAIGSSSRPGDRQNARWMPRRREKSQQIVARDRRRHSVEQRMIIERGMRHHRRVENDADAPGFVVDGAERRYRARLDAESLAQQVGRAEGKSRGAKAMMQAFELDHGIFQSAD